MHDRSGHGSIMFFVDERIMIRLFAACALSLLASQLHAADDMLGADDCKVFNPYGQNANRVEWSGACKDGFAHGTGNLDFDIKKLYGSRRAPVARYEGAVERGRMHGEGKLVEIGNTSYTGGFRAGEYHGKGKLTNLYLTYEGDWQEGRRHGVGKIVFAIGGSYEGEWARGEFHGKGVVTYAGGRKVSGEFINGMRVGETPREQTDNSARFVASSDTPVTGRWVWDRAWSHGVPQRLGYHQMTAAQQQLVRNSYPLLDETDEPPYPLNGIAGVMRTVAEQRAARVDVPDSLTLDVMIDKTGTPVNVKFYPFSSRIIAHVVAAALLSEKYKPALCQGTPCDMSYRFRVDYVD